MLPCTSFQKWLMSMLSLLLLLLLLLFLVIRAVCVSPETVDVDVGVDVYVIVVSGDVCLARTRNGWCWCGRLLLWWYVQHTAHPQWLTLMCVLTRCWGVDISVVLCYVVYIYTVCVCVCLVCCYVFGVFVCWCSWLLCWVWLIGLMGCVCYLCFGIDICILVFSGETCRARLARSGGCWWCWCLCQQIG